MKSAYIYDRALKVSDGKTEEEIDLVFIVGSSIILGEIKCSLFPSEPLEIYRFFRTIDSASKQVKRKADFVEKNITEVLRIIGREDMIENIDKIKISPIVITNLPYGSGLQINNVPITDQRILSTYIRRIQDVFVSQSEKDGTNAKQAIFYNSEEEAETNIIPFLKSPLSVRLCRKLLDHKIKPFPIFENFGKKMAWLKIFVNEERLDKRLWENGNNPSSKKYVVKEDT